MYWGAASTIRWRDKTSWRNQTFAPSWLLPIPRPQLVVTWISLTPASLPPVGGTTPHLALETAPTNIPPYVLVGTASEVRSPTDVNSQKWWQRPAWPLGGATILCGWMREPGPRCLDQAATLAFLTISEVNPAGARILVERARWTCQGQKST